MLSGESIIGCSFKLGEGSNFYGINPATNERLAPTYYTASPAAIERACFSADFAFDKYRETSTEVRAEFLETIAENIEAIGDELIIRAMSETGLPRARLEGERGRTVGQLKMFARELRSGRPLGIAVDEAQPNRTPLPRSDIRLKYIGVGPVAVFGASNFPLAFSVAGGDTAAALAAGCPVVVKAHPAHPGTSELVGRAVVAAVKSCGLPVGVFSLLFGIGNELGSKLVENSYIKAVGFTGSRAGGIALMNIANARHEPIPVYAEMSSINPVYLLPNSLDNNKEKIAAGFVTSLTQGAGQFCTNPGLVFAKKHKATQDFLRIVRSSLEEVPAQTMLTPGIADSYQVGIERLTNNPNVQLVARGQEVTGVNQARAHVFITDARSFQNDASLQDEIFGPVSLVVICTTHMDLIDLTSSLEGQLTATIHADRTDDLDFTRMLVSILERKVGRILFNGWPTGVEVCNAMVHGGPFPATSDGRSTSVGAEAVWRFLRPVSYQDFPVELLEDPYNNRNIPQIINGVNA